MHFGSEYAAPRWIFVTLWLAGIYNLLFGAWVILLPHQLFALLQIPEPKPIAIWQCVGMIVGVYGFGYICAAYAPARHWPIVLVGLIGKLLGPIGFYFAANKGDLPWKFGYLNITNDLIWWIPFSFILARAWRISHNTHHRWFS